MRLYLALLLSLVLHFALIAGPAWLKAAPRPSPAPTLDVRLVAPPVPEATAEAVSTEPASADPAPLPQRLQAAPRPLRGASLRRAQAALTQHLFYPPEAVARGLEGDVVLLLSLADNGQLLSAEIARGSGHALLDQAALDAARNIGALPGTPRQTLFPVSFRLR